MKLSTEKTGNILIPVNHNSEWDSCNFCLVTYNEKTLNRWKKYVSAIDNIANESDCPSEVYCLCIWEQSTFLCIDEENDDIIEIVEHLKTNDFAFVTLEKDEEDTLSGPEQRLDSHQAKIYKGSMCFLAYGEHTSEEFWTDDIIINEL